MVTINGKKMGKSLGNAINLNEFFTGDHALLTQAYHPITVRFFFLQAHYRSTLDFSNEALQAAEKGLKKMINGLRTAKSMTYVPDANVSLDTELDTAIQQECQEVYDGLNADFNTAMGIAALYNLLKRINSFKAKLLALNSISQATFEKLVQTFVSINEEVLGISESKMLEGASPIAMLDAWMESYQQARANKDFALVDTIRANFKANQIIIKDSKEGSEWAYEE